MDLGAGLGVHGLNAARLGAARVLLIEPAPVIQVARQIAAANQLHNVFCFPCRVEELALQEKVDLIVSVFTGNFLFTEDLLPSLFYARDHFLVPGGKMIPDCARMEVLPVMAAEYYQTYRDSWSGDSEQTAGQHESSLSSSGVRPLTPAQVLKASDQPALSARGAAAQWLLAWMTGEFPVSRMAAEMREHYPEQFASETDALRFAKDLAEHYS